MIWLATDWVWVKVLNLCAILHADCDYDKSMAVPILNSKKKDFKKLRRIRYIEGQAKLCKISYLSGTHLNYRDAHSGWSWTLSHWCDARDS